MAGVTDIVAHTPGAAFAVDRDLTIIAWNGPAERATGRPAGTVVGRACFETMGAVDADSGRPCVERCPLAHHSLRNGWVHSRILQAPWQGARAAHLDCMLLYYVLPTTERGALSFITPLDAADAREQLRMTSALEALQPLLSGTADLDRSLASVVQIVLRATGADTAELHLFEDDLTGVSRVIRQARDPSVEAQAADWLAGSEALDLVARSDGALVAVQQVSDPAVAGGVRWGLAAPLRSADRSLGLLSITSQRPAFSIGHAARQLFVVAGQLGVFLRWASLCWSDPASALDGADRGGASLLRLYCFGRFRIVRRGHEQEIPSHAFRRQKSLRLLKILAAHRGRPLHREALIELLWPDADPVLASSNLRVVLHDLRHTLEPELPKGQPSSYIVSLGDLIYLDPSDGCWIDVEAFERLVRTCETLTQRGQIEAALKAGREAAALYTADYLEDEPYADWCAAERERLRAVCIDLLFRMALSYAERGQIEEAIAACRQALAVDPLREQVHRQLVLLLGRAGRRDEALRQFESCRRLLLRELGVSPDEATWDVYRGVRGPRQAEHHRPRADSLPVTPR